MTITSDNFFPATARFVKDNRLLANATGDLAARLPRILGQGKTRAAGLDLPPAIIERQKELCELSFPTNVTPSPDVLQEITDARNAVKAHSEYMRHLENQRRFSLKSLSRISDVNTGNKDNHFFAGQLVLVSEKDGQNWAWSITPHYPIIEKIPADVDYVVQAHQAANEILIKSTLPIDIFLHRLELAWIIARYFSAHENVLIDDVATFFKISVQEQRFWTKPLRRHFRDIPDAVFIANLINWRKHRSTANMNHTFELVPATLNQAYSAKSRPFYVPSNAEGTAVRPMIYMRRNTDRKGDRT